MNNPENTPQEDSHQNTPYHDEKSDESVERDDHKRRKKHTDDLLGSLTWALILIWAGLVFLAANLGMLDQIPVQQFEIGGINIIGLSTWSVIFLGAGILVFFEALLRTFVATYRSSTGGNFFLAAVLLGIGLGGIIGWRIVWPFILIGMGLAALASALIQQRS